jgi:superfamily I DNA/RNA helicase/RecB family exonuclease
MLKLNSEQLRAIEHGDGPLLVIAGPGSGKTRVITQRIVHLLGHAPGLEPQNILALTFTEKAAGEMKSRVCQALPDLATFPHVSTFHSFAYELVCSGASRVAPTLLSMSAPLPISPELLDPQPQERGAYINGNVCATRETEGLRNERAGERMLLDKEDVWVYLRERLEQLQLEFFQKLAEPGAFLHALGDFFSRCQDELIEPEDFEKYAQEAERAFLENAGKLDAAERALEEEEIQKKKELSRVFYNSRRLMERAGSSSLGSLIPEAVRLFDREAEIRQRYRAQFRFVLVDEFQDTNYAQVELLRRLVAPPFNITAVGDDDQAIYRFRGASHGAFDLFGQVFPGHQTIFLNRNYRSTERVLRVADVVIKKNENRYPRKPELKPEREEGCPVYLMGSPDYVSEANGVADEIQRLVAKGHSYRDVAVLYRAHAYRDRLAEEFGRRGIPFAIRGLSVLSTVIIRDLLAYLKLVLSPHDNISLTRVLLAPRWNFPEEVALEVRVEAEKQRCSLYDVLTSFSRGGSPCGPEPSACLPYDSRRQGDGSPFDFAQGRPFDAAQGGRAKSRPERKPNRRTAPTSPLDTTNWAELNRLLHDLHWAAQNGTVTRLFRLLRESLQLPSFLDERDLRYVNAFEEFLREWEEKISKFPPLAGPEWEKEGEGSRPRKNLREFLYYFQHYLEAGGKIEAPLPEDRVDAVQMMTVHAAKGLEFPVVFVLSVASRRFPATERRAVIEFPDELRKGPLPPKNIHLQEERRLFFVGLTRAQDRLYVSSVAAPGKKPSKFIDDLLADPVVEARDIARLEVKPQPVIPALPVIPAKAGIQSVASAPPRVSGVDSRLRGNDDVDRSAQPELFGGVLEPLGVHPPIAEWAARQPEIKPGEKLRLSASSIEDYEDCPLKFKFGHYLKIPTGPQAALTFGNIMHRSVRRYFELRAKGEASFEAVKGFYESSWRKTGFEDEYQEQTYKRAGLEQLRAFVEKQESSETLPLAMESSFLLDLGEVWLEGRIDQINPLAPQTPQDDRAVELIDYKTGKPRSQKDADSSLQLSVYALAAQEQMKLRPRRLTFYCLTNNQPVHTVRTEQDLKAIRMEILTVADRIRQNHFPAAPGFVCKFCHYRPICPAHEENF